MENKNERSIDDKNTNRWLPESTMMMLVDHNAFRIEELEIS